MPFLVELLDMDHDGEGYAGYALIDMLPNAAERHGGTIPYTVKDIHVDVNELTAKK